MPQLISIENITDGSLSGSGHFDTLMRSISSHLNDQFDKNRISGKEYSNVYIQAMSKALELAFQFELQKETTDLNNINLEKNGLILDKQVIGTHLNNINLEKNGLILDKDALILDKNGLVLDKQVIKTQEEINLLISQDRLIQDQRNTERAKTQDTLIDGITPVTGIVSKDKDVKTRQAELYVEQKNAYTTDRKVKVAKAMTDSWTVQKSVDSGLTAPDNFTNSKIDQVISDLKIDTGLTA